MLKAAAEPGVLRERPWLAGWLPLAQVLGAWHHSEVSLSLSQGQLTLPGLLRTPKQQA